MICISGVDMSKPRERFYRWIWKDLLRLEQPITLIIRDWFHWPLPLFLILVGVSIGHFLPSNNIWWVVISLAIGIFLGHIFWPTKE